MKRDEILQTAINLTMGDRNQAYGDPKKNLDRTAELWSTYLGIEGSISAKDVAAMMVLLKLARAEVTYKPDNYIDAAAYMAIMGEVSAPVENHTIVETGETVLLECPSYLKELN